jgi:hypothetical protein
VLFNLEDNPLPSSSVQFKPEERRNWLHALWPLLVIGCVLLLWAVSFQNIDFSNMNDLGLVSVLPPTFFIAFLLLVVSFSFLVNRQQTQFWVLILHIVVLVFMLHGTPAVVYETLRYAWSWKHVGIVDYIQRYGSVDPTIYLNVYHQWPGFFALSAFITEVTGFESALSFANWAQVFFNLFNLGALLLIMKSLTQDQRLVLLCLWFFFLTNWVGQDYFSPQALTFSLYLVMLGICLGWFKSTTLPSKLAIKRFLRFNWIASLLHQLLIRAALNEIPNRQAQLLERAGLMLIAIIVLAIIVFSHPLTSIMAISSLTVLVVFHRLNASTLPILMFILTVTWISYMAVTFLQENFYNDFMQTIGRLFSNFGSNIVDISQASPGQVLVNRITLGLTASVGILALLGGIRRLRCGNWDLTAALLVVAPTTMLAATSYGGEIVFRVYLFSLPSMAFFVAALLYPNWASGTTSLRTAAISVLLSSLVLGSFFFAYYGDERQNHYTRHEFEASQFLYNTAPQGSLLIEGTDNYPSRFKNYELFSYATIDNEPTADKLYLIDHPVETLLNWMSDDRYSATYLIITRSQKAEVDVLGVMPPGSLDKIEQALKQSPEFKVIYSNKDASIFVLSNHQGAGS